jgi:D-3-phosphoglycerate dehydrogenase
MSAESAAPARFRVLVADNVSEKGIELLRSTPGFEVTFKTGMKGEELRRTIGDHEGLIVRSATKVTADVLSEPGRLRVIGRAGTGVDNIDLEAATRAGIVVMNTPGGNSIAAAELTMAHLTALARNVPQANSELREGRWERKKYMGVELSGKVMGIVGLGRIGREVARRASAFRMELLGYDPFVSAQIAADHGIESVELHELIERSDIITLHLPFSKETANLIDADALARMKPGALVLNCARGGLIDETALLAALDEGKIGGAGLDVFSAEPPSEPRLVQHPRVVATPHLGASTREAQERVGTEIAEKIRDYLQKGLILDAINFPAIGREDSAVLGPVMDLAERLGSFLGQTAEGGFQRFEVRTFGTIGEHTLKPVVMAAVKGLLAPVVEGSVSYVNALGLADERGITVEEGRSSEESPYAGLLRLTLETDGGRATVAGTLYGPDRPRLVEVDGVSIESRPAGHKLCIRNRDVPGVLGKIGTILGRAGVNINGIQLGLPNGEEPKGEERAVSIIDVDMPVPKAALDEIRAVDEVVLVRSVSI